MQTRPSEKPKQVVQAVNQLWFALALAPVKIALSHFTLVSETGLSIVSQFLFVVLMLGIGFLVVLKASAGRNWARKLIFLFIAFLLPIGGHPETQSGDTKVKVLENLFFYLADLLQGVFVLSSLWLLFTNPGRKWFLKPSSSPTSGN